jgi:uncharacterized protein (DUF433 family)
MGDEQIIRQYVAEDPDWSDPVEARIAGYGVPVWALIGYLRAVDGDLARTAQDYDVPEEAVRAAVAYYRRHQRAIDARLIENSATTA